MKKKGKTASIVLSIMMLMQVLAITSFAAEKELTWSIEPFEGKIIGADYESDYSLENFVFCDNETNKYGIMDKSGNVILNAQLDFTGILHFCGDKYMRVYKKDENGTKYAIYNSKGEAVIDFGFYDGIEMISDNIVIAKKGELYGIVSPDGKVRTDFIYSEIRALMEQQYMYDDINYVCAKKDGKYGVIDADGKVIIPFEHDAIIKTIWDGKFYTVGNGYPGQSTYLMDTNGKILVDGDIRQINCDDKVISVAFRNEASPSIYVDKDGKILENYSDSSVIDGYNISFETDKYYCIHKEGKYGLADKNMNILIPVQNYRIYKIDGSDEIFRVQEKEFEDEVYVDANGNPINYLSNYSPISSTKSGYIIAQDKKSYNYGMIDKTGSILIPFEYSSIREIKDGVFFIEAHSKRTGIAEFGTGKKVKDTFEGLILKIDSKTATAFNKDVEMDVAPIIRNGRTMLPARFVAENLGAEVSWDETSQTVTIGEGTHPLKITIGSSEIKVGPYARTIDSPAFIENGRTYVPVRVLAENLGADVSWEQETQTVKILKK